MVKARMHGTTKVGAIGVLVLGCLLAGCGSSKDNPSEPGAPVKLAVPGDRGGAGPKGPTGQVAPSTRGQDAFKEATVQDPPEGQWLPETGLTKTGKSIGKLYEAVVAEWNKVPFVTPEGKKLAYTATITTELGAITIELWPEIAPNHVRNFVALARAGYYDGLAFDRAVKRREDNGGAFECLEGGCPVGTGEATFGSIGYWLKPEFSAKATHEAGTIGAWHGEDVESAGCKFYINLTKAEWMDGNFTLFGKVTQGFDVVGAIHSRPVREDGFNDRPVEPVVMRKVTVSSQ
jgi:peptidyl-prolyl cis-trans isomerase B (cyclophilin B)